MDTNSWKHQTETGDLRVLNIINQDGYKRAMN